MRKLALRLAYDGTDFVGSQWQAAGRSVQGVLEHAWTRLTQEERRMVFAGRTDAGVHAQGQVAHVQTETRHDEATIQRALNALLPADVMISAVWPVSEAFHARYSARWRHYRYVLDVGPLPSPLLRRYALHVPHPLDRAAMHAALAQLVGEHDFAAFASLQGYQGSTVRSCYRATCEPQHWFDQPLLAIELVANGFLRHMVRSIVGTLLQVGQQRLTKHDVAELLHRPERQRAGPTAAAHGLALLAVGYPEEETPPEMQTRLKEDRA
jgi:tRNA pseudouridine38-40 synthase